MTCREMQPLLGLFEDGSLPQNQRPAVVAHLAGCLSCRERVERRQRLGALLRGALDVPDPGEDYFREQRTRLLAAGLRSQAQAPKKSIAGRYVPIAALLAASALLVVYGPGLVRTSPAPQAAPVMGSATERSAPEHRPEAPRVAVRPQDSPPGRPKSSAPIPSTPRQETPLVKPEAPLVKPEAPVVKPEAPVVKPESPVVKPELPPVPTPEKGPAPAPAASVKTEEPPKAVVLAGPPAGSADRMLRMSRDAVEVALAETPIERVVALCAAAEAQLRELEHAVSKDPQLASELAGAYRLLVLEGVGGVLQDQSESAADLHAARDEASRRVRGHEATLLALGGQSSGALKASLSVALEASRSISGR